MREAVMLGYPTATDFADYLVRKGLPFRDAHEAVGCAVRLASEKGCGLHDLTLEELREFSDKVGEDVYDSLTLEGSIASRNHTGGTAPSQVAKQVGIWKERLRTALINNSGTHGNLKSSLAPTRNARISPGVSLLPIQQKLFSVNLDDPAFRTFDFAHLDTGQCFSELGADRTHLFHAGWEVDIAVRCIDHTDRSQDGSRTAKSSLQPCL